MDRTGTEFCPTAGLVLGLPVWNIRFTVRVQPHELFSGIIIKPNIKKVS
jgi:hypothetical protein